jgi:lysyl-tRNA synthetase class 2
MDLERLKARADSIRRIRAFFEAHSYLELDTPALSPDLIPETCLEAFETEWLCPHGERRPLYLVPSPEVYIKPLIAAHRVSVFQLSKCYRNGESVGRIHSPEFTMLEYYTMNASYMDSVAITESLFDALGVPAPLAPPFLRLTVDEAFSRYAGFRLSDCAETGALAAEAARLSIAETSPFADWAWDDLYELILAHAVEPALPKDRSVVLTEYPARVPCLAKDIPGAFPRKERWELYAGGMELANCYSEETDAARIKAYFEREGALKARTARVPHRVNGEYWRVFRDFPACSGVALGVDRLIALICGAASIDSVLPFPLR